MKSASMQWLRSGLALTIGLGLLAACQDRGQFKARVISPEEQAAYNAKMGRRNGKPVDPNSPPSTPAAPDPTADGNDTAGTPAKLEPSAPVTQPPAPGSETVERPQTKMMVEKGTVADLKQKNDQELAGKDVLAGQIVKGMTVNVEGLINNATMGVDAVIVLNGKTRALHILKTPVTFHADLKSAELTNIYVTEFGDDAQDKALPESASIVAVAFCADASCTDIQLRIEVPQTDDLIVPIVIDSKFSNGKWVMDNSNFTTDRLPANKSIESYVDALTSAGIANRKKVEIPKPMNEAPKAGEAPKAVDAPKAGEAPKAVNAPKAADAPKDGDAKTNLSAVKAPNSNIDPLTLKPAPAASAAPQAPAAGVQSASPTIAGHVLPSPKPGDALIDPFTVQEPPAVPNLNIMGDR